MAWDREEAWPLRRCDPFTTCPRPGEAHRPVRTGRSVIRRRRVARGHWRAAVHGGMGRGNQERNEFQESLTKQDGLSRTNRQGCGAPCARSAPPGERGAWTSPFHTAWEESILTLSATLLSTAWLCPARIHYEAITLRQHLEAPFGGCDLQHRNQESVLLKLRQRPNGPACR